jgi:hypothetical protein
MPEAIEAQIPAEVREQFHRDDQGRILLFSSPPRPLPAPEGVAPEFLPPEHSVRYLAQMKRFRERREKKRGAQGEQAPASNGQPEAEADATAAAELSRLHDYLPEAPVPGIVTVGKTRDEIVDELVDASAAYLRSLLRGVKRAHAAEMEDLEGWKEVKRNWDVERRQRRAAGENV